MPRAGCISNKSGIRIFASTNDKTDFTCKLGNGDEIPCTEINGTNVREEIEEKATTLILSDHKAYDTALTNAGIDEDWVEYSTYTYTLDFVQPHASRRFEYKFADFPTKNASMVVPNPKDIVTEGIGSIPALRTAMQATLLDIMLGQWTNGSVSDAAQAYSVPVFLLMQAIDDMETAKKLGAEEKKEEEEEEKRKKDFILLIVSVVLMVSHFVLLSHFFDSLLISIPEFSLSLLLGKKLLLLQDWLILLVASP